MSRTLPLLAAILAFVGLPVPLASAQLAGSRAGAQREPRGVAALPLLDRETAESYIAIDGRAEVRVQATEIRIVLAVTGEADSAAACRDAVDATVARLKEAWSQIGVAEESLVVDFISVLPRYEWKLEQQSGVDVGVERQVGFRMQTSGPHRSTCKRRRPSTTRSRSINRSRAPRTSPSRRPSAAISRSSAPPARRTHITGASTRMPTSSRASCR